MTSGARAELVAQWVDTAKVLAELQVEKAATDGDCAQVEANLGAIRYLNALARSDRGAIARPGRGLVVVPDFFATVTTR
jgi:hypothetical protein